MGGSNTKLEEKNILETSNY